MQLAKATHKFQNAAKLKTGIECFPKPRGCCGKHLAHVTPRELLPSRWRSGISGHPESRLMGFSEYGDVAEWLKAAVC